MTIESIPVESTLSDVGNLGGTTKVNRADYLLGLLSLRGELPSELGRLQERRDRAFSLVHDRAIPTTRDEEWRFTDLSDLLRLQFQTRLPSEIGFPQLEDFLLPESTNSRLVFVDGVFAPALSAVDDLPDGVLVGNLVAGAELVPALPAYLANQPGGDEVFTALNTASFTDGAIAWVPKNSVVEAPIHLLFVSTTEALSHPRCLVVAQAGSCVTLIEEYVSLSEGRYFTNSVTEIYVEENAEVRHTRVQRDSVSAFHIGKTAVSQARDSRYTCTAVSLGAKLARHHLEIYQTGEQTDTTLNGLTLVDGDRVGDTHSLIALSQPYGTANQVNKTVVRDRAHAVFNGKVWVPKAAQMTNAAQLSRNLLLSPKARVDTKPQLEITADNVKCAHGATVSQLEDDEVFYLQSRGIPADQARKLLTYAFAIDVIDRISVSSLRDTLTRLIRVQTS
ncbi:Fe-S cluster assembly protein SufD [Myxacorys almedinensis]|uniref:Fe-S cluster assembly protein SufD n=1 Tax=Myxacorys almedinensis A TaxID=2690445 RepID=A0A8J8CH76_9CYAN|nr:Fe-S cluster assembly protein SufD [Myxacorys almedinensis]NDJ16354.1 Fe-S cluster assembly protein SufD [Myxacorys almedinensis A]